jgi:hypothetical protein
LAAGRQGWLDLKVRGPSRRPRKPGVGHAAISG